MNSRNLNRCRPVIVFLCLLLLAALETATAQSSAADKAELGPPVGQGSVVQDFYGGQIFGYDVDRLGTEGLLSEALHLPDGKLLIATETFDQITGRVIAVIERQTETDDDFVTLGVVGSHIGLREQEHVQGLYVNHRTYSTINPLAGNHFNGVWLPPINDNTQFFEDIKADQGNPNAAVMVSSKTCCSRSVFGANVGANRNGPIVVLQDPLFTGGVPPLMAYDGVNNQAVLAQAQGAPYSTPEIGLVNLTTRAVTEFTGLGDGFINGLAVDSATGIACTTTETDNSAEFYNLATHSGFVVFLPIIGRYSAATVANDPIHKLFLITHPRPGAAGAIHVYDENGNFVETLDGFSMGPAGAYIALNPSTRKGFLLAPGRNQNWSGLQSFTY